MRTCAVVFLGILLSLSAAWSQGFGKTKKKITLHRKLPPAAHLTGALVAVKVVSNDARNADLVQQLSDVLETELLKNDNRLKPEKSRPDMLISCSITGVNIPPPQIGSRNMHVQRKSGLDISERYQKITGSLNVAYQAKDMKAGRVLDSDNITAKYAEEFDQTGEKSAKSWNEVLKKPLHKIVPGKQPAEVEAPPNRAALQQILVSRAAAQIAARLVNTDESVEAYLARGKLDETNRLAESGLWNRMLEVLETMQPFPKNDDDAYRLYNIAVGYEALAYQAEDLKTAKKFFEQAAINYGKAIDANPHEKYFLEPQNRIQTAIAHYKKLEQHHAADKAADKAEKNISKSSGGPLTNEQIIQLAKAGLDEDNLIATIKHASSAQFDFSVDAQLQLIQNGVKSKVISAMRERAQQPARRTPSKKHAASPK